MRHPLHVAFVWHMHQPYYLDEESGELILPWVRLHATKDYLHMAEVLEDYPRIHATFNMVPSLVEQLQGYVTGANFDRAWKVSLKEEFTAEDRRFIDSLFFSTNKARLMEAYPRYLQLQKLREIAEGDLDLFGDLFWRDLVAWFNLAWIDPTWLQRDPALRALAAKGSHFTLEDIGTILAKQREIMAVTLAAYRRLQCRGQVELSVSPYYHPILPLLIDSNCAREASPWLRLPDVRFQWREDALAQLKGAVAYHEAAFGRPPAGLWPSEGSVSQGLVALLKDVPEIRWLATDEAILARSLGRQIERNGWGYVSDPRFLYQPYRIASQDQDLSIFFRDHYLSDRIGFVYKDMTGRQAAEDLMFRFVCIHEMVKDDLEPYCVCIILDGENCWEHYEQNGETFLRSLYELLSAESRVRTVTVSEFLNDFPPRREIPALATGSWINGNFETWIGEPAQNRAWEYLARTREALAEAVAKGDVGPDKLERAHRSMMAAEGSDWFWWYYSHNVSAQDEAFDRLFRQHLAGVYRALDLSLPDWLSIPILAEVPKLTSRAPSGYVHPSLAPDKTSPEEWAAAGYIEPRGSTGAMQLGSGLLKRLYFGYDERYLFLRLESHATLRGYLVDIYVGRQDGIKTTESGALQGAVVRTGSGSPFMEIAIRPESQVIELSRWQEGTGWVRIDGDSRLIVAETVLEASVSLDSLGVGLGSRIGVSVVLFKDNLTVQRLPEEGEVAIDLVRLVEGDTVFAPGTR